MASKTKRLAAKVVEAVKPAPAPAAPAVKAHCEFRLVPMDLILEPELPMREGMDDDKMNSLVASIDAIGLTNPITLMPADTKGMLMLEIVAGHRRYIAHQILKRKEIPAMVWNTRDFPRHAVMIHENVEREDLNDAEQAIFYTQLMEANNWNFEELVKQVRKKEDYVGDRLRLIQGCTRVFQSLREGHIKFGVARELNKITDEPVRHMYLNIAEQGGANHRTVADWVRQWKLNAGIAQPTRANTDTPEAAPPIYATAPACFVCGGNLDPYNLVNVWIHKWEYEAIIKKIRQGESEVTA